jgi:ABC-type multidrug transport system fused ATPase/permease subunit
MMMPPLLNRRRGCGLAAVAGLILVQGTAAGAVAFATRGLFEAMHQGAALPVASLATLVSGGVMIAATRVAARQLGERIGQDYARHIRVALFEHAARMPAQAAAARRAGYMSLRFVGDMTAFRNWLAIGLPRLIAAAVLVPTMLAVLLLLAPVFAMAVVPVLVLALLGITWGGARLVPLQRCLRRRRARIAAEMAERMPLAPALDRLGRRGRERHQLDKRINAMVEAALRHRLGVESLRALPDLAAGIAAALVVVAGYGAGLGTGDIAAALAALGLLLAPLRDLGGVWNHRAAYQVAARKAEAALSRAQRDVYRAGESLPKGPVDVVFEDVALPSGNRLSFRAEGGKVSDLVVDELDAEWVTDVLLGLDAPRAGRVLLSGIDLADLSRGTLRRNVQCLSAQPTILQGSLRRALVMGCDERPDDATLEGLARDVGLGSLLERLGGLNGTVLERGKNLTRSERVAIARARMILSQPRLVVVAFDIADSWNTWPGLSRAKKAATVICLHAREQRTATAA